MADEKATKEGHSFVEKSSTIGRSKVQAKAGSFEILAFPEPRSGGTWRSRDWDFERSASFGTERRVGCTDCTSKEKICYSRKIGIYEVEV